MNKLIKILENNNVVVDHDKVNNRCKVISINGKHFKDEVWFGCSDRDIAFPVKRKKEGVRINVWHGGYCPKCGELIRYNFTGNKSNSMKQYCWKCGQLVDFEEKDK